jgi:hypothetical protein
MRDPMTNGCAVLKGSPLSRLVDALGGDAASIDVLAGDVADVCHLCDGTDPVVAALAAESKGYPGRTLSVSADDARHLVGLLVSSPEDEDANSTADVPADVPAPHRPRKSGKKPADGNETI